MSAEQAADTVIPPPWHAEEGRRYRACKRGKEGRGAARCATWRGAGESGKRIRSEQDARLRDTTVKKTEMWRRRLGRDRRAGRAMRPTRTGRASRAEREIASGRRGERRQRERKGLSRGRETYIFRGANETAQCGGIGLSVLLWSSLAWSPS